ncbi:ABC-type nitrate/sulfonate/bicarbonate transport system substrate-binding protein [Gracilibacillus halotolerans]|uniref:ABC-type nitrate/sulfonate/bicarbonate transport system substrate-binding protein n=1 Tax=Gracilibacillus halotolerans TaxID=74386 RepID=A0A841RN01_9BACI|nr:ABC transporter substrate-binding protein [Gracilibacillus halotolerans]MBB6513237.1 ABC-type nitrate/sulfonate/bicarbonate transport system substrate-binding protein [Gracilibacillus halotolerans]
MRKYWTSFTIVLVVILLAACGGGEETTDTELTDVTLVLDWTPNTNHTGIYVAEENGYFEEQGINVDIIMPGESGPEQTVASGQAEFAISAQETVTEARVQDIPIVSIGAIIQHNTSGFAAPTEYGITSPKDFAGKKYGGWGAPVEAAVIDSLMKQEDASVEDVEIINIGNTDFFTAIKRDIDFAWIYYAWTGIEAELRGEDLDMLYLTDYSDKLDYYTPVIITSEELISEQDQVVAAFMKAISDGYQFAIENPDEAADILVNHVPDLDSELVHASQEWLSPKYQDDADRWGVQSEDIWQNYADWMYENELIDSELDVKSAFTNEFIPE